MTPTDYFQRFENGGYVRTTQLLTRFGLRAHDAAEYAQAGWVRCFDYIDKLRDERSLDWYVATAGLRVFQTEYRRSARHGPLEELTPAGPDPSLSTVVIDVRRALSKLKPLDSWLLQQVYIEGASYAELADQMDTTEARLYAKAARVRRAFRKHMNGVVALNCTPVQAKSARTAATEGGSEKLAPTGIKNTNAAESLQVNANDRQ